MSKIKLKSILSRAILGETWQERDDYLYAGFENNTTESQSHEHTASASDNDENDDRSSADSFSTTATTSNLPGTGRTIDMYIYQPVGRRVERLAKRITALSSNRRTGSEDIGGGDTHSTTATAGADDKSSASSINSFSTTATVGNLPGAGRSVDTYIYQPMGRRIERLAMRYTISFLHPSRIAQYIEGDQTNYAPEFNDRWSLNDIMVNLSKAYRNGPTVVAGMKGLVKQTQSNSINKSASALAALIRVSLTFTRKEIYVNVALIKPIFHLEALAASPSCSGPERRWFLLLAKLARETLIAVTIPSIPETFDPVLGKKGFFIKPLPATAQRLRLRLIRALKVYRLSGFDSPEHVLGDAFEVCAEAVSTCIDYSAQGEAYMHILDTVYYAVIFVLRSIHLLSEFAKATAKSHIYLVVRTIACWTDAIVFRCLYAFDYLCSRFDEDLLKAYIAFRSLVLVYTDASRELLPQSLLLSRKDNVLLDEVILPRRYREAKKWGDDNFIVLGLIETAERRTRRLLRSFNELEREAWGCTSQTSASTSKFRVNSEPDCSSLSTFDDGWWNHWASTLARARRVQVPMNRWTKQFRKARRIGLECDPADVEKWRYVFDPRNWANYRLNCRSRHKWGQYLRSSMDWDWGLARCMKRLFKVEKKTQLVPALVAQSEPVVDPAIDVEEESGGTLQISMGRGRALVDMKEIQITSEPETGETQYMPSSLVSTNPGNHPVPVRSCTPCSSSKEIADPTILQQDTRHRSGEQAIEDVGVGASSSATPLPEANDNSAEEETREDCEEKTV